MNMNKMKVSLIVAALSLTASMSAHAVVIDTSLTSIGATATINGGKYTQLNFQPAGTGVIDSFVQIGGANKSIVEAYNTTVNNTLDNGNPDNFNRAITVGGAGGVGFIDTNGATAGGLVMRFLLDINQNSGSGTNNFLSLDEVQVFLSNTPNQSVNTSPAQGAAMGLASSFMIHQLDTAAIDNRIKLDYDLGGGSGSGDMTLEIPYEAFALGFTALGMNDLASRNGAYIYLYSRFGSQFENNDGFEEWAAFKGADLVEEPCIPGTLGCGQQEIPEPNNLALLAIGLLGVAAATRKAHS